MMDAMNWGWSVAGQGGDETFWAKEDFGMDRVSGDLIDPRKMDCISDRLKVCKLLDFVCGFKQCMR